MTEAELDSIEAALGVRLPAAYRRLSLTSPFTPIDPSSLGDIHWFYEDPTRIIEATRSPLSEGDYPGRNWRRDFVVIGNSGGGDLYVIDAAETLQSPALPVYCLSHEDHELYQEWTTLEEFTEEFLRAPGEYARQRAIEDAAQKLWWKRAWKIVAIIGVLGILVPLIGLLLIHFFAPGQ